jgi:hypothetical protein
MLEEALATLSWKGEAAFLKLAQDYARAQCPLLALMFTSPMLGQAYAVNQDHSQALQELESVAYLFESAGSNTAQLSTMQFAESTALVLYSATVEIGFPRPMSNPQSVLSRSFLLLLNLNNRYDMSHLVMYQGAIVHAFSLAPCATLHAGDWRVICLQESWGSQWKPSCRHLRINPT